MAIGELTISQIFAASSFVNTLSSIWPPLLAVVVTIVAVRIARDVFLLWRSRSSRVQVSSFAWSGSDGAQQEATWVTSLFREQLAALRLDALDPLPERAPGAPLVEIVEGVGQSASRDIGAAAGRLYKAMVPDSAYEVWGSLRPRTAGGGRIAIQLIERRHGNRTLLNVALDEAKWEDGAREAALAVAGALYPRVRKRDRGPWALWKKTVPREVVRAYHNARRYESESRLEYALEAYETALEKDPLNPNLRLKVAMLQERLELDLDAWVTYEAIAAESNPCAWRGPNRRVYLLALYRIAVILTNGRIPEQWTNDSELANGKGCKRDQERKDRREQMLMSLERDPLFDGLEEEVESRSAEKSKQAVAGQIASRPARSLLRSLCKLESVAHPNVEAAGGKPLAPFDPTASDAEAERKKQIEAILQILALRRLEELEAALAMTYPRRGTWRDTSIRRPKLRRLLKRRELSRAAVRVSKLLVRTRIAAVFEERLDQWPGDTDNGAARKDWREQIRGGQRQLTDRWPFPVSRSRQLVHRLSPRRLLADRREDAWQLHYNAACATASILREDSGLKRFQKEQGRQLTAAELARLNPLPGDVTETTILRRSIAELKKYAYRAGSNRLAAQAERVAFDDPDLSGLRNETTFKLWVGNTLPPHLPNHQPSRESDIKRFTIRVMKEGAGIFAASWRDLAAEKRPPAADLVLRWKSEADIWKALGQVCTEHLSWEERLQWLRTLQERLRTVERGHRVDFGHQGRGPDSISEPLFDELAILVDNDGASGNGHRPHASVYAWANGRFEQVRNAYRAGEERADRHGKLREKDERDEALRAARIWAGLVELLEVELDPQPPSKQKLRLHLTALRDELV